MLVSTSAFPVFETVNITPNPLSTVPWVSSGTILSITTYGRAMLATCVGVVGAGSRVIE